MCGGSLEHNLQGVSNHWTRIWNGMVNVNGTLAYWLPNLWYLALVLLSHHRGFMSKFDAAPMLLYPSKVL